MEMYDDIMDMILLDRADWTKESISDMSNRIRVDMEVREDHADDRCTTDIEGSLRCSCRSRRV